MGARLRSKCASFAKSSAKNSQSVEGWQTEISFVEGPGAVLLSHQNQDSLSSAGAAAGASRQRQRSGTLTSPRRLRSSRPFFITGLNRPIPTG